MQFFIDNSLPTVHTVSTGIQQQEASIPFGTHTVLFSEGWKGFLLPAAFEYAAFLLLNTSCYRFVLLWNNIGSSQHHSQQSSTQKSPKGVH